MRPSVPDVHITDPNDAELAEYRLLAWQAVLGLIFGLLAPLAFIDPLLWALPVLGIIVSWWALRRIRRYAPAIVGRKMAVAGLVLSLVVLVAASTDSLAYGWMLRREAQQFSASWFKDLAEDQPQKAHQLTIAPQLRQPPGSQLWTYYRNVPKQREQLEGYVKMPLVRTLLALGPRARVRFYQTVGQVHYNAIDDVDQLYAVTYEEDNERKSFFVLIHARRQELDNSQAGWRVLDAEGGVRPEGWSP